MEAQVIWFNQIHDDTQKFDSLWVFRENQPPTLFFTSAESP